MNISLTTSTNEIVEGTTFDVCVLRENVPVPRDIQIMLIIPEVQQGIVSWQLSFYQARTLEINFN